MGITVNIFFLYLYLIHEENFEIRHRRFLSSVMLTFKAFGTFSKGTSSSMSSLFAYHSNSMGGNMGRFSIKYYYGLPSSKTRLF